MANDLIFYTNPMSRSRVVRWALEEVGQPYKAEILDYGTTMKAPPYLAINPMGKVPALRHGDVVVTEVVAICTYLADAFPQAGLAPKPTDKLRGEYYRWLFFCAGPLEAAVTDKSLKISITPEQSRMVGYGSLTQVLDVFEKHLDKREYIVGDKFSMADLVISAYLAFYMQVGSIEKRAAIVRYTGSIANRPAAIRANEIDEALMPKKTA